MQGQELALPALPARRSGQRPLVLLAAPTLGVRLDVAERVAGDLVGLVRLEVVPVRPERHAPSIADAPELVGVLGAELDGVVLLAARSVSNRLLLLVQAVLRLGLAVVTPDIDWSSALVDDPALVLARRSGRRCDGGIGRRRERHGRTRRRHEGAASEDEAEPAGVADDAGADALQSGGRDGGMGGGRHGDAFRLWGSSPSVPLARRAREAATTSRCKRHNNIGILLQRLQRTVNSVSNLSMIGLLKAIFVYFKQNMTNCQQYF